MSCSDFLHQTFNWNQESRLLMTDTRAFNDKYSFKNQQPKEFNVKGGQFTDSKGNEFNIEDHFEFTYSVGWKMNSNYEKCFFGDQLKRYSSSCEYQCTSKSCLVGSD